MLRSFAVYLNGYFCHQVRDTPVLPAEHELYPGRPGGELPRDGAVHSLHSTDMVISGYFWLFLGVEQVRYTDRFLEKLYHLHDIYVMISVVIQQYFSNILKGLSFAIQLTVV
jgi:hypothetical protein